MSSVFSLTCYSNSKGDFMDINEALLNEMVQMRQTLERIATALEDIDDTLEIMFLMEDYEDEELEEMELLDSFGDDIEFGEEDKEVDVD